MTAAARAALRREVRRLIRFYDRRGWDWLDAVAFTIWRATRAPRRSGVSNFQE